MAAKYLNLRQLARTTSLPMAWLKREADAGRIPCLKAGRSRMFDLDRVRIALQERSNTKRVSDAK